MPLLRRRPRSLFGNQQPQLEGAGSNSPNARNATPHKPSVALILKKRTTYLQFHTIADPASARQTIGMHATGNWNQRTDYTKEGDDQDHEHCAVFGALEKEQSQSQDYMPHPGEDRPVGKDKQVIAASTDFAVIAACQSTSIERCGEDHHPLLPIQGCSPSSGGSESCLTLSR